MKFHDPARPRLTNSLPCWLTAPDVALPRINITPWPPPARADRNGDCGDLELQRYALEVIIDGSQKIIVQTGPVTLMILEEWSLDPEAALTHWWHAQAPSPISRVTPHQQRPQQSSSPSMQTAREGVTAEDLF